MSSPADEAGMEERFHRIKKKYDELENLRISSVRTDCEDLRQKIDEHRRIHEIAVKELRMQNDELRQTVSKISSIQRDIQVCEDSIAKLRYEAQSRDTILNAFLKYPQFHVKFIGRGSYRISSGSHNELEFDLLPNESAGFGSKLLYRSIQFPPEFENMRETEFVRHESITFDIRQVHALCDTLRKALELCRGEKRNKPRNF